MRQDEVQGVVRCEGVSQMPDAAETTLGDGVGAGVCKGRAVGMLVGGQLLGREVNMLCCCLACLCYGMAVAGIQTWAFESRARIFLSLVSRQGAEAPVRNRPWAPS